MGPKDRLRRAQDRLRGNATSIELADGSRYWFEVEEARREVFRYFSDSLIATHRSASRPEPPAVVKAVSAAKDRRKAYSVLPLSHLLPIEVEPLIERGEFVPRSLVAGGEVEEPIEDLSEP